MSDEQEEAVQEFLIRHDALTPEQQRQRDVEISIGWEVFDLMNRKLSNRGAKGAHYMKLMIAAELIKGVIAKCPGDPAVARRVVFKSIERAVGFLTDDGAET